MRQALQGRGVGLQAAPQWWTELSLFPPRYCCSMLQWPARTMRAEHAVLFYPLGEGSNALLESDTRAEAKRRAVVLTMRKAMMGSTCRAFSMTKGSLVNSDMS